MHIRNQNDNCYYMGGPRFYRLSCPAQYEFWYWRCQGNLILFLMLVYFNS
jgi:hypothetical protein